MPVLAHEEPIASEESVGTILATTLSEADLNHMLDQLGGGRSGRGMLSRFSELHRRIPGAGGAPVQRGGGESSVCGAAPAGGAVADGSAAADVVAAASAVDGASVAGSRGAAGRLADVAAGGGQHGACAGAGAASGRGAVAPVVAGGPRLRAGLPVLRVCCTGSGRRIGCRRCRLGSSGGRGRRIRRSGVGFGGRARRMVRRCPGSRPRRAARTEIGSGRRRRDFPGTWR